MNNKSDDKKSYQINISLTTSEYALIKTLAELERRTLADITRLILIDNANALYYEKYSNFTKALFIPNKKEDQ